MRLKDSVKISLVGSGQAKIPVRPPFKKTIFFLFQLVVVEAGNLSATQIEGTLS